MAINFGADPVNSINFQNLNYVAITGIVIGYGTYYRDEFNDGACANPQYPYAWKNDSIQYVPIVFTESNIPDDGNDVVYPNGSWLDVIYSRIEQPVPQPVYAVKFNNQFIFGKERNLYVTYDSTQVNPITVNRRTVGYEPTAVQGIMTGEPITGGMQYAVYPNDEIEVFAVAKAGYRIVSGTGSFVVSVDDTSITVNIVSVPDTVEVSGYLSYMVADDRTTESIRVTNYTENSVAITAISGRRISDNPNYSLPLLLPVGTYVDLNTYVDYQLVHTGDYQVTVTANSVNYTGTIEDQLP